MSDNEVRLGDYDVNEDQPKHVEYTAPDGMVFPSRVAYKAYINELYGKSGALPDLRGVTTDSVRLDDSVSAVNPKGYLKAIGGAILAGLITLGAVAANAQGITDVTFLQWVLVATSALGTGLGVWAIPNAPVKP